MGLSLIDLFCAGFEAMPERIVLDIDDTSDAVHGGQQLALFNAHYDDYCFQPIHIFEAATGKPVLSLLRPGKRPSGKEVARILRHVIRRIRHNWPRGPDHRAWRWSFTARPTSWNSLKIKAAATSSAYPATPG